MKKWIVLGCALVASATHAATLLVSTGNRIERFDSVTGASLGTLATFPGEAAGLAFDSAGNLFAAAKTAPFGAIYKITPTGAISTFATGVRDVTGLAFDGGGDLYAADASGAPDGQIFRITPEGTVSTFATGLVGPFGLAFDSNGTLFVACNGTGSIKRVFPGGGVASFAQASNVVGLAFDTSGLLFASQYEGLINKFTPGGTSTPVANLGAVFPNGLAFDSDGNLFCVSGGSFGKIYRIAPNEPAVPISNSGGLFIAVVPATVPEPSSFALVAIGVAMLSRRNRETRKRFE